MDGSAGGLHASQQGVHASRFADGQGECWVCGRKCSAWGRMVQHMKACHPESCAPAAAYPEAAPPLAPSAPSPQQQELSSWDMKVLERLGRARVVDEVPRATIQDVKQLFMETIAGLKEEVRRESALHVLPGVSTAAIIDGVFKVAGGFFSQGKELEHLKKSKAYD